MGIARQKNKVETLLKKLAKKTPFSVHPSSPVILTEEPFGIVTLNREKGLTFDTSG